MSKQNSFPLSSRKYQELLDIHPNILIAGPQVIYWILFCPSTWRRYRENIKLPLKSEIPLGELTPESWQAQPIRRIILSLLIWALLGVLASCSLLGFSAFLSGFYNGILVALYIGMIFMPLFVLFYFVPFGPFLVYGVICRIALNVHPLAHEQKRQTRWFVVLGVMLGLVASVSGVFFSYYAAFSVVANTTSTLNADNVEQLIPCTGEYNGTYYAGIKDELGNCPPPNNIDKTNTGKARAAFNVFGIINALQESPLLVIIPFLVFAGVIKKYKVRKTVFFTVALLLFAWGGSALLEIANDSNNPSRSILCQAFPCHGILDSSKIYSVSVLAFLTVAALVNRFSSDRNSLIASSFVAVVILLFSYRSLTLERILIYLFMLLQHYSDVTMFYRNTTQLFAISLIQPLLGLIVFFVGYNYQLAVHLLLYPLLVLYSGVIYWLEKVLRLPTLKVHPVFLMEYQPFFWPFLYRHLVLVIEKDTDSGQKYIARLAGMVNHSWVAQEAQIELDARSLELCSSVDAISKAYQYLDSGELQGPASALLRSFSRISKDVEVALYQETIYNRRLALSAVEERLDGLLREFTRSSERYTLRFRPIAETWRRNIADYIHMLMTEVESRQEIDSPYIIGVPLTAQQEVFIGRSDISARIEQLLLDQRRPPLLLYGQRRMGKTSLLNNLGRLLPSTIIPLFVDLQGPASRASDHTGLFYFIARSMIASANLHRQLNLPPLSREALRQDPFGAFDDWLVEVERVIGDASGLLMFDEFEVLDKAIARERFDEESVLGTLRHIIQHRPRLKILLAGSHTLEEFRRWAGYLINVQVVRIAYLQAEEALQLMERPVKSFTLRYESAASQRILALTHGHPFLVQLLCAEVVALKNTQEPSLRRLACLNDVEAALPKALAHGDMFFADIARNQVDTRGLALLRYLASMGEGVVADRAALLQQEPNLEPVLRQLIQRDLIETVPGGYRFQVELIRRWFAQENV